MKFKVELAREEKCEFIPYMSPARVIVRDGKICAAEFYRTEQNENDEWIVDNDQIVRLKANYVISAFGSGLQDQDSKFNEMLI